MRLLLVRHGETDWNADARIQGSSDIPLNRRGIEQARRLHERLASVPIDAVYTSDLSRCVDTARIVVGARRLSLRSTPLLREICYGTWEGKTRHELETAGYGPWLTAWNTGAPCAAPAHGETREQVDARIDGFFSCIFPRHVGETVLVVSHGGPLRLLITRLLGRPVYGWGDVRQANTALTEAMVTPGKAVRFVRVNDTAHLDDFAVSPVTSGIQGAVGERAGTTCRTTTVDRPK